MSGPVRCVRLIFRFIDPLFGKTLDRLLKELDREDAQDRGSSTNLNKALGSSRSPGIRGSGQPGCLNHWRGGL